VNQFVANSHYYIQEGILTNPIGLAPVLCSCLVAPAWGEAIFTDGTFNLGDWPTVMNTRGARVNHAAAQQRAGGNPVAHLQFRTDFAPIPAGSEAI
jgi:hypothetical protein